MAGVVPTRTVAVPPEDARTAARELSCDAVGTAGQAEDAAAVATPGEAAQPEAGCTLAALIEELAIEVAVAGCGEGLRNGAAGILRT